MADRGFRHLGAKRGWELDMVGETSLMKDPQANPKGDLKGDLTGDLKGNSKGDPKGDL
jgi:hypothetical protein